MFVKKMELSENNFISDDTGTIAITIWGVWIDYFSVFVYKRKCHSQ